MARSKWFLETDLDLEAVILLIAGTLFAVAGLVLFLFAAGWVPYDERGLYGALLFVFSLQIVLLGKTPFGDRRRSPSLLALGVAVASVGIATACIPGLFASLPPFFLALSFGLGGLVLLGRMMTGREQFPAWMKAGGPLRRLALSCLTVHLLSILIGVVIAWPALADLPLKAAMALSFGLAVIRLALVLQKVYDLYPQGKAKNDGSLTLSPDQTLLVMTAVFMILIGLLLLPVSLGLLPFSASAQLGLLMIIFSVQMVAFGSTPVGPFRRSRALVLAGLLFASLGVISCAVPGLLVLPLTVLVATLNIAGGLAGLVRLGVSLFGREPSSSGPVPSVMKQLVACQLVMNLLALLFGTSMLLPGLIGGFLIGVILAANGAVLLLLLKILIAVGRIREASDSLSA